MSKVAATRHTAMPEGEQAQRMAELLRREAALSAHGGTVLLRLLLPPTTSQYAHAASTDVSARHLLRPPS